MVTGRNCSSVALIPLEGLWLSRLHVTVIQGRGGAVRAFSRPSWLKKPGRHFHLKS
jgi:hypothetical protein